MNREKKTALFATAAMSAIGLLATPAEAEVVVAAWDAFTAEPAESSSAPTYTDGATGATMAAGTGGNWSDWNNNGYGASDDGTFGNLDSLILAASTSTGAGTSSGNNVNLSLNRSQKPGSLVFSLVNNSGADRVFEAFYFDGVARFSQSAPDWELTFSDAISGTAASGSLVSGNMSDVSAANRDQKIDLSGLSDNVWENGTTATFTLSFSGGSTSTGSGGGQETLVDNIAFTVAPIPEPTSLALIGLGGVLISRRRRA